MSLRAGEPSWVVMMAVELFVWPLARLEREGCWAVARVTVQRRLRVAIVRRVMGASCEVSEEGIGFCCSVATANCLLQASILYRASYRATPHLSLRERVGHPGSWGTRLVEIRT